MGKSWHVLFWTVLIVAKFTQGAVLINASGDGGMETGTTLAANGWVAANGLINKWFVGTGGGTITGYTGARCLYVSSDASGNNNNYSGISHTIHVYYDFAVLSGEPDLTLSFRLKVQGNSGSHIRVYIAPNTVTPTSGTAVSSTYIISPPTGYYNYPAWTTITLTKSCVSAGNYRLIFTWTNSTTVNNPAAAIDDISLTSTGCSPLSGTGFVSVATLPYSVTGASTCGAGNDLTASNTLVQGSVSYYAAEDAVYHFRPTAAGIVTVTLRNAGNPHAAVMAYKNCPAFGALCGVTSDLGYNQNQAPHKVVSFNVQADSNYYILVDGLYGCTSFDLTISAPATTVANDAACGATVLTIGQPQSDMLQLATATGEPAVPVCWVAGTLNTLWYSFTAPASGQVHFAFQSGTLTRLQMELFSGSCSSLSSVAGSCVSAPILGCPGPTYIGLTPGALYYVRVDGDNNEVGSFTLAISDGTTAKTPLKGDCHGAIELCGTQPVYSAFFGTIGCGSQVEVPAPGTISNPNVNPVCCNGGCLLNSEINPTWFRFTIATSGTLAWSMSAAAAGYYDWSLWNITNSSCSAIPSNTLAPVRCNWNATNAGFTGMQSPVPTGGNPANFETPLAVTAGETYVLCLTNWNGFGSAFTLDFSNSTCTFGNSVATWVGYQNTNFANTGNWTGCTAPPSCAVDAVINATALQPVVSSNAAVRNLTINPGATLTINAGVVLTVCGNFINNGSLVASATSTVLLNGSGTQNLTGSFTNTNTLGNLTVTKTTGTVIANAPLDIAGNFVTSNATSVFNANGQTIRLSGNFSNAAGSTTFTNVGGGTLEFRGAAPQSYAPGGALTLNNVLVNQSPASTITLSGNLTLSGSLTLTSGRIVTGSYEVNVTNASTTAVVGGGVSSYVDGNLRRSVNPTGSYNFPVGHSASGKGYQLANVNFTAASNVTSLVTRFSDYTILPGPLGVVDCGANYNLPALNNGYWSINSTPAMSSGAYTLTLYNTAGTYTNAAGAVAWTVMRNSGSGWSLAGNCAASTVNQVVRTGLTAFSDFGTAQASLNLPVELVSFAGSIEKNGNLLTWETASQYNNDYFVLEHSRDGKSFLSLATVPGEGNVFEPRTYSHLHRHVLPGNNYYRLKQVDTDQSVHYSHVILLHNDSYAMGAVDLYPNPTDGLFELKVESANVFLILVEVTDPMGRSIRKIAPAEIGGNTTLAISIDDQPKGLYLIQVTFLETGQQQHIRLVKN